MRDAERVADLLRRGEERTVTKTFVFTDIEKSTELLETIGDRNWANTLRRHDDTLRAIFTDYDGQVVDHTGDGFFVAFEEVEKALQAAVAVQRAVDQEFVFDVRIGMHTDGALQRGDSFRGRGVHTAARVGAAATGREILVTAASVGPNGVIRARRAARARAQGPARARRGRLDRLGVAAVRPARGAGRRRAWTRSASETPACTAGRAAWPSGPRTRPTGRRPPRATRSAPRSRSSFFLFSLVYVLRTIAELARQQPPTRPRRPP